MKAVENGKAPESSKKDVDTTIQFTMPAWLSAIGRQSPLAMVLLVILYFFRVDGLKTIDMFTAHNNNQKTEFLQTLYKLEEGNERRADRIIKSREAEVDRLIKTMDKLSEAIDSSGRKKPAPNGSNGE